MPHSQHDPILHIHAWEGDFRQLENDLKQIVKDTAPPPGATEARARRYLTESGFTLLQYVIGDTLRLKLRCDFDVNRPAQTPPAHWQHLRSDLYFRQALRVYLWSTWSLDIFNACRAVSHQAGETALQAVERVRLTMLQPETVATLLHNLLIVCCNQETAVEALAAFGTYRRRLRHGEDQIRADYEGDARRGFRLEMRAEVCNAYTTEPPPPPDEKAVKRRPPQLFCDEAGFLRLTPGSLQSVSTFPGKAIHRIEDHYSEDHGSRDRNPGGEIDLERFPASRLDPLAEWEAKEHLLSLVSPREREVLLLMMDGRDPKQIADELGLALDTVYVHRRNARKRIKQSLAKP